MNAVLLAHLLVYLSVPAGEGVECQCNGESLRDGRRARPLMSAPRRKSTTTVVGAAQFAAHTVSTITMGFEYPRIARGDAAVEAGETPTLAAVLQSELTLSEEIPPGYLPLIAICSSGLPSNDRMLSRKLLGMCIRCGEQDNSCKQQRRKSCTRPGSVPA